jgi:hypothetical protein
MSMTNDNCIASKDGSSPDNNVKGKAVQKTDGSVVGKTTGKFSGAEKNPHTATKTPRQ